MTESENQEEKRMEENSSLPHLLSFIWLKIKWGIFEPIIRIPGRISRAFNRWGWIQTFKFVNSATKKSLENVKGLKKVFKFRDWMFNRIIEYMTMDVGWVLTITRPKAEHLKTRWIQMAFINPQFLEVKLKEKGGGVKAIRSIELLPHPDHLETEWHVVNEEHLEHIMKQDRYKKSDEFITEVNE